MAVNVITQQVFLKPAALAEIEPQHYTPTFAPQLLGGSTPLVARC